MSLLWERFYMTQHRRWRLKMSSLFGGFLLAAVLLPFLPFQVLGFCLFQRFLGIPCPGCGIRSSIAALVQGNIVVSLHHNLIGPLVLAVCFIFTSYFIYSALFNKGLSWNRETQIFKFVNTLTFSLLLMQWVYKLMIQ